MSFSLASAPLGKNIVKLSRSKSIPNSILFLPRKTMPFEVYSSIYPKMLIDLVNGFLFASITIGKEYPCRLIGIKDY